MGRKAYAYLRVSSDAQAQAGKDGFPRQRTAIKRYARKEKLTIVEEFRDEGISGTRGLGERPGLGALMDRLESNGVDVVLIENASRIARDLLISEVVLDRFRQQDVRVIAAESGTDLTADDNPTSRLIRQLLAAISEYEKSVLVGKLESARARKRRQVGKCEGQKFFGERPGEQPVVERILAMRRKPRGGKRLSYAAIAAQLNESGIPTRGGRPWRPSTVQSICKRHGRG